jgi:hypothetical protein
LRAAPDTAAKSHGRGEHILQIGVIKRLLLATSVVLRSTATPDDNSIVPKNIISMSVSTGR